MSMEAALLESRTLRATLCTQVEVLDEVKALVLLPNGIHVTTRMVAEYFEVGDNAVYAIVHRHRAELTSNGYTVLKAVDNSRLETCNLQGLQVRGQSLALFSRRAVLNVAMLLRDSMVARQVRSRLLDTVEAAWRRPEPQPEPRPYRARPWKRWNELRWDEYEAVTRDPAAEAWRRRIDGRDPFDLDGPQAPVEERLGAIERRLAAGEQVAATIGERVVRQGDDLRALRREVLVGRPRGSRKR